MGGVSFPITEDAKQGIHDLKRGSYNYLQFKIGKLTPCNTQKYCEALVKLCQ